MHSSYLQERNGDAENGLVDTVGEVFLPSIFPSILVFSNESALRIR